jgi:hypothetical protein
MSVIRLWVIGVAIVTLTTALLPVCASGEERSPEPRGDTAFAIAPNQVIVWNMHTANVLRAGLPQREQAIVNVAMFEAVNAITRRYRPYALELAAPPKASVEAAAATAAHHVLVSVEPARKPNWDTFYAESMAGIADSREKADGIGIGAAAAAGILALRETDVPPPGPAYTVPPSPGVWRVTPLPDLQVAVTAQAYWKPWTFTSSSRFRPGPPPPLTSAQYAADLEEVKAIGARGSTTRTAEQTGVAHFWEPVSNTIFVPFAERLAITKGLDETDSARFLALLTLALADGAIAVFDAKYAYDQWRPVTAIREADTDDNPATTVDPNWIQLLPTTPPFPDYPSGHAVQAAAAAEVFREYLDTEAIVLHSPATGATRHYKTLDAITDEVIDARVWGGIHFRTSDVVGARMGTAIGKWVVEHFLGLRPD